MKTLHQTPENSARRGKWLIIFGMLWVGCSVSQVASAQTVDYAQTRTSLQTKVNLHLGETKLPRVLEELSQQTGLKIEAADFLQERELLVELENMSAQAVLDTLAEGNDWIWFENRKGHLLVTRPRFKKTQELLNVAPAFRAIVPKDLRRFVGVDLSDAEIMSAVDGALPDHERIPDPRLTREFALPLRLQAPITEQENAMIAWVTKEVRAGTKIPYAKLTPEQQHSLLVYFVFTAMRSAFDSNFLGKGKLIQGLNPALLNEDRQQMTYRDGSIMFSLRTEKGEEFIYAEGRASPERLPDPLLLKIPR